MAIPRRYRRTVKLGFLGVAGFDHGTCEESVQYEHPPTLQLQCGPRVALPLPRLDREELEL
jgi:hypothetical protein